MRRLVNRHPGRGGALMLGALPFLILVCVYLFASHLRAAANADDKLLPTPSVLASTIHSYAFEEDLRSGSVLFWQDTAASLERLFVPSAERTSLLPTKAKPIDDPSRRAAHVTKEILKYATISAALGAFPIPGLAIATDLGVIALQVKMVRDIGQYWGHALDREAAKSMLYGLGLGTGARLAVNNLAKLLPGWGSAVGATTSFASTYALGKVLEKFFAAGAQVDISALKKDFKAAEKEGKATYAEHAEAVAREGADSQATLDLLTKDLKEGKITQAEMDQRLADMAEARA